ncbi:MAG: hypothetical protein JWP28_2745 [Phenylobacterium sp.]|uniref:permease n=1 Tax=Phenylobacterium sp. TaxID=1871053 RepID=UPI0026103A0F|nr:permease [Phenylobacterium sp.]MDB5498714.1 hypothetical protein [Phenylobacterium sp.]
MEHVLQALRMAAAMGWLLVWPLILGFGISAAIQAVVSHGEMAKLLPDDRPRSLLKAALLGAASSSCSYAAVAIARSMFRKGANFNAAMAFQFASTNLVLELGIVLWVMLGWRFTAATWAGGIVMIVILSVLLRLFMRESLVKEARAQAEKGVAGRMEGHADMDMAVTEGPLLKRLFSPKGFTATSHYFVMDWASVWVDLLLGFLIAGALAAWVPNSVWAAVFFTDHPVLAKLVGPLLGPLVAVASFVCSVGNVPLAAVLWNGGASFGGVISFIFADLIILPILDIYRRYYGLKVAAILFVLFYAAMALAGYVVELAFGAAGLVPSTRAAHVADLGFSWNYTTWLNLGFMIIAAVLVWRFLRTGGPDMLRHMGGGGSPHAEHDGHTHSGTA